MMKFLCASAVGGYLAALSLLAFHAHAEHTGDLHKSHSPCVVCAHSSKFHQKAAPQAVLSVTSPILIYQALFLESKSDFSFQAHFLNRSRAPPL
jgi:hypothetical protein